MTKNELKQYLKDNLEIVWRYEYDTNYDFYLAIELEGETISRVEFERD